MTDHFSSLIQDGHCLRKWRKRERNIQSEIYRYIQSNKGKSGEMILLAAEKNIFRRVTSRKNNF